MIDRFDIWVFDCDGVLLDSNVIKTSAFRSVTRAYGVSASDALIEYHLSRGGISRYQKFRYLFDGILGREPGPGELDGLLRRFAELSAEGLKAAAVDPSAFSLLEHLRSSASFLYVASGGEQEEVRNGLRAHGLAVYFDGIFGSPMAKTSIVADLAARHPSARGALVGDSRLDMEIAAEFGFVPILVTHWSEFRDWGAYVDRHPGVVVAQDLAEILTRVN